MNEEYENGQAFALVGASDFNAEHFLANYRAGEFACVIAIDRGFAYLQEIGVRPDIALGDFDSLGYVPQGVDLLTFDSHKDKSDMELAFDCARSKGAQAVSVYGALGKRLDHTLANLGVFAHASEQGMRVTAIDCGWALRMLTGPSQLAGSVDSSGSAEPAQVADPAGNAGLACPAQLTLPAREVGICSVFAMDDEARGVTIRGLEYPLEDAVLTNRTSLGLSNEFIGEEASISVQTGTLAVIFEL